MRFLSGVRKNGFVRKFDNGGRSKKIGFEPGPEFEPRLDLVTVGADARVNRGTGVKLIIKTFFLRR
jgi:hypothetical protein